MKQNRPLRGVIPVLVTPLNSNGNIDDSALRRLVTFLIEKEVGGLWVLGTGSEDMNLTFKKRLQVAQTVCETNAGRLPLILGTGFFALDDILNFTKETKNLEFDAYHVMPYHPLLSLDRLEWFYNHIADNSPKLLWIYTSANWARPVTPEFIARLKPHPNITGIKFSTRNCVDMTKVLRLAEDSFQVITAVAAQFFSCLALGSKAHTSSLGSALPEPLINIYKLFQAGKHDAACAAQHKLNDFLQTLPKGLHQDNFLGAAEEKFILSLRGICQEYTKKYKLISDLEISP
jgi:4-hydroxy-tetrahydrodipicolinate synthase